MNFLSKILGQQVLSPMVEEKKVIAPFDKEAIPFSPEEQERRKREIESLLMGDSKPSLLDKIKKGFGSIDVKGEGMNEPIPEIKFPEDDPRQPQPRPADVPLGVTGDWESVGRPSNNPYYSILEEVFGDDAPNMDQILRWGTPDDQGYGVNYGGENLSYDPTHVNINQDGSRDIGLFQINENTFNDFIRRKPDLVSSAGINQYEDLFDPTLNARMAKIILDEQGYGAWYGAPQTLRN